METRGRIGIEVMEEMKRHIGEEVIMEEISIFNSNPLETEGKLKKVHDFKAVEIGASTCPFIGWNWGIVKIVLRKNNEVVYENSSALTFYRKLREEGFVESLGPIDSFRRSTFGNEIGDKLNRGEI